VSSLVRRVLLVHNYYQQVGGEDLVFDSEKNLLQAKGHEVFEYTDTNARLGTMNRFSAARETVWSVSSYHNIKGLIVEKKPDVVHFHNTFLVISPAAYYACHAAGVPVVQTLHNYRLSCPSAIYYRDGKVCEDCLGRSFAWPGVLHSCYRGSRSQSLVVAAMLSYHRLIRTWSEKVAAYISLTVFGRDKMIEAGLPPHKIFVKPNFVLNATMGKVMKGDYALFVGRLTPEKGLIALLRAWSEAGNIPLKIAGDGALRNVVEQAALKNATIQYLGYQDRGAINSLMRNARFLVFPSEWYEGFPMTIAEAFACAVPVVASRHGAMTELVRDGETGLLFDTGDVQDLAAKVRWLWDHPEEAIRMGQAARQEYRQKYTPERNYQMLSDIYETVIAGNEQ
jgi:glycosyltransferase involved in cell wall biosynthesis